MAAATRTIWIQEFKGLNDSASPGSSPVYTRDLNNVKLRRGLIFGRGGMAKAFGISTASTAAIIGLFNYKRLSNTHELLRMLPTKVEKRMGSSWIDVTGTALIGTVTTRPQFDFIDDILVFTNEGLDRPRRFTGSGNTSTIQGTPPFAKSIKEYLGYLFLGNVSDNGTFTDGVDSHRTIRYNDDPFGSSWAPCEGNTIILDSTPGSLLAMERLGRSLYGFKTDGIERVTWTGGATRFNQEGLPVDVGVLAPLSVARVGEAGICFLGTDAILYQLTQQGVQPISIETLADTLPPLFPNNKLQFSRAVVDSEEDTYYLFYDNGSLSGQLLNSFIGYNFRTKEFFKGSLGQQIISTVPFKATEFVSEDILTGGNTLVRTFDDLASIDDDGVQADREVTTGWQKMEEEGWVSGLRLIFKRSITAKVRVSIAVDLVEDFIDEQSFSLKGTDKNSDFVEILFNLSSPIYCNWANLKVRFYHNSASARSELSRMGFEVAPTKPVATTTPRAGENLRL